MDTIRRYMRIAIIGYLIVVAIFATGLWGLHRHGYTWAAKLDHDSWAARGNDYLARRKLQGARQEFHALLAVHPDSPTGWNGLITSHYLGRSKPEELLKVARQARDALQDSHPTIGDLLYARALFRSETDIPYEQNESIKEVEEILESIEDGGVLPAEGWHLRSEIAFANGLAKEFVEALDQLAKAPIEGSSDNFKLRHVNARAVLQAADESIHTLQKTRLHMILGEWNEIRNMLSTAEVSPAGESGYLLGIMAEVDGDISEAAKIYGQAAASSSNPHDGPNQAMHRLWKEHGDEILNP